MRDLLDLLYVLIWKSGWEIFPTDRHSTWSEVLLRLQKWGQNKPGLEVLKVISFYPHTLKPLAYGLDGTFSAMSVGGMISTFSPQYEEMIAHDCPELSEKELSQIEEEVLNKFKELMIAVCIEQEVEWRCLRTLPRDKNGEVIR